MFKYVRCLHEGRVVVGVLIGDSVHALNGAFGHESAGRFIFSLREAKLLAPTSPSKVVAVAMNYFSNLPASLPRPPSEPVFFLKPPSSVVGHMGDIVYPSRVTQLDFEAELAVVIGASCHNVEVKDAEECVLGYTCANDVTARDLQRGDMPLALCKSFDTFCPLGPTITSGIDPRSLSIQLRVNGQVRQSSTTGDMVFDPFYLVSYVSSVMTLEVGDVILTGTPSGVGSMQAGDRVEVEIEGIGILSNRIVSQSHEP